MSVIVDLKRNDIAKSEELKDVEDFLSAIAHAHSDRWVAILRSGEILAEKKLGLIFERADRRHSQIVTLFHAPREGHLLRI